MGETIERELRSAELLQQALLPKKRHFDRLFSDSFVFYRPKEYLSGDFYWVGKRNKVRYLVVGDCSGHGVSAALVTVLMLNLIEYAIMNKGIRDPDKILREIDKRYIESFTDSDDTAFDNPWVDLSVISIDDSKNLLTYSSANRKLLHVRDREDFTIHKSNGYPLGGWQVRSEREFESREISFEPGDALYIGSDGFQDQFGGGDSKKFGSMRLHQLLAANSQIPFELQCEFLAYEFRQWKSDETQTDDVCIVGVKL